MVNNDGQELDGKAKNIVIQSELAGLLICFNESGERGNQVEFQWRMII